MNKKETVNKILKKFPKTLDQETASIIFDLVIASIFDEIVNNDKVLIHGLGTFKKIELPESKRIVTNIMVKNKEIKFGGYKRVSFRMHPALKKEINAKKKKI